MRNMELESRRRASCELYYLRYRTVKLDKMKGRESVKRGSKVISLLSILGDSQSVYYTWQRPPKKGKRCCF